MKTKTKALSVSALLLCGGLALLAAAACTESMARSNHQRVLVLGFDGMDPNLAEAWMADGSLPNLKRLKEHGDYRHLGTSIPPQSPVAWSNFITGMNPGGHRIFDFIHRNPETYLPDFSMTRTTSAEDIVKLGKWNLPLKPGKVELMRKGKAFWLYLEDHGIPSTVFMVPSNFPPVPMKGHSFSGMGTPDIEGTYGMFAYYTDHPPKLDETVSGGRVFTVDVSDGWFSASLLGPKNEFLEGKPKCEIPFMVHVDAEHPVAKIDIQGHTLLLAQGEWSDWIQLHFDLIPYVQSVSGIVRVYLKEVRPEFKLYITPVNIDPSDPAQPICTPDDYSKKIYDDIGFFYTQGMSEDTKAFDQGVFSYDDFYTQAEFVLDERMKLYERALDHFDDGFLFFYFSSSDLGSHMFWGAMEPADPAHVTDEAKRYAGAIKTIYKALDKALGIALDRYGDDALIIVMSDHGFGPYRRSFNLNSWLKENGYVTLYDESMQGKAQFFRNVNWSKTKLYALGFNGIYVNQAGREKHGIVQPGPEKDALLTEVARRLVDLRDPKNGEQAISHVYRTDEVYSGRYKDDGPDLEVGYHRGYRVSWQSALCQFPTGDLFEDNEEKWSGDHLGDAAEFAGVLFANRKIEAAHPALYDLAPTILAVYGIEKPEDMVGHSVFGP